MKNRPELHNSGSLMQGVLAINKPAGLTSRQVASRVERIVRPLRVGHTGTLDPLATGVLLLAVGQATRLVEFSHLQSKSYEAEFVVGASSPTLDTEGEITQLVDVPKITRGPIENAARRWVGKVKQTPPRFSAVHVDGKRAYDLARKGREFEVPEREVEVHAIEVVFFEYPRLKLRIECGTGTYIHTLGSDIARECGSDAVMCGLVRTRIGSLGLEDCIPLEDLSTFECVQRHLHSPKTLVESLDKVALSESSAKQIRNGIPIELPINEPGPIAAFDEEGDLAAVLKRSGSRYRSLRVFQKSDDTHQPSSNKTPQSPES